MNFGQIGRVADRGRGSGCCSSCYGRAVACCGCAAAAGAAAQVSLVFGLSLRLVELLLLLFLLLVSGQAGCVSGRTERVLLLLVVL